MGSIVSTLISVFVLIVVVWVVIFGGVGALLSRSRGGSGVSGFAWGTLLGPFGWIAIYFVSRSTAGGDWSAPTRGDGGWDDAWDD